MLVMERCLKVYQPSSDARHITLVTLQNSHLKLLHNALWSLLNAARYGVVGGSTDTPDTVVHATCKTIQEAFELRMFAASQDPSSDESMWDVPVVLFRVSTCTVACCRRHHVHDADEFNRAGVLGW